MDSDTPRDVLLVEDEADLARGTVEYLEAFGVTAAWVGTAEQAASVLRDAPPRLLLLDVNRTRDAGPVRRRLAALGARSRPVLGRW